VLFAATARAQVTTPDNLTFDGGKSSFTMPFELVDNRIFVSVTLEGKGPFRFILDTGGYGGISGSARARSPRMMWRVTSAARYSSSSQ
jgi:hypothetical protein